MKNNYVTPVREEESCAGKVGMASLAVARKAAKRKHKKCGVVIQVYHCRFCHLWHVGSKSGKVLSDKKKIQGDVDYYEGLDDGKG